LTRLAIISDVHANLEALEAVLGETRGLDIICLGDLVDYGANPNETVELVRDRGIRTLMGNHDWAAVSGDTRLFNPRAAMSSIWTQRRLTGENLEYIRTLPLEFRDPFEGQEAYFTHGSPDDRLWEYVDPRTHTDLFGHYLSKLGVGLIGLGHTHIPYVWVEGGKTVFNPGSVGQPRDGDPRASFAVLSVQHKEVGVEVRRVGYDIEKAASKIRSAGLPESHASRLFSGT
jgi:diadenosine tetraphosphatase ApaH/serine/threonine PP2A family protein phosphatase